MVVFGLIRKSSRVVSSMIHECPASERNKSPILNVLLKHLPVDKDAHVLEIASGPGTHMEHFAHQFPKAQFQPSEVERAKFASLLTMCKTMKNVAPPLCIDISKPAAEWRDVLPWTSVDVVININMIHICKWNAVEGLFQAAGVLLERNGFLLTYGPYAKDGKIAPESNVMFNSTLKQQNPEWGLRDITDLKDMAKKNGLELQAQYEMPANNDTLIFVKV